MTEKQRKLAERNGILKKMEGQPESVEIRKEYSVSEELAEHRKAIADLYKIVASLVSEPVGDTFSTFNEDIEDIKKKAKEKKKKGEK